MPELPEVITIINDLKKELIGKKITDIKVINKYKLISPIEDFNRYALNTTIVEIDHIGKMIVIKLSSNMYISCHLKMTGNLLYNTTDPYIKVSLTFDTKDKLHFSCVRKFGYFEIWDQKKIDLYRSKSGVHALDNNLDELNFIALIRKKKTSVRNALLDQSVISGLGNIYINDALFLAGINPKQLTKNISDKEYKDLFSKIREVLYEGISNRGISMDRYKDIYGKKGRQQEHFKVYGKKNQTCVKCKTTSITYEKIQGRGTYYCSKCQPLIHKNA